MKNSPEGTPTECFSPEGTHGVAHPREDPTKWFSPGGDPADSAISTCSPRVRASGHTWPKGLAAGEQRREA